MSENKRRTARRTASLILSLLLCLTLMPVGAFAEAEEQMPAEQDNTAIQQETSDAEESADEVMPQTEQTDAEATYENAEAASEEEQVTEEQTEVTESEGTDGAEAEEPAAEPEPVTARAFKIGSYQVELKSNVLVEEHLDKSFAPSRAWVTGNKKSIRVEWSKPENTEGIAGYIVLRKVGKAKVYTEIRKVSSSKFVFTDTGANKKDTEYNYIVAAYSKDGSNIHISPCSAWAAGVLKTSKLQNGYEAKISKTSSKLQVGGTVKLTIKYSKPKTIFKGTSFRWASDDKSVAKISKGTVTAVAPGKTTIRVKLASGAEYTCKITVVGAFKPGTPAVERDYSTKSSIALMWAKTKNATSYDIYCSKEDADNYELIANVTGTEYLHEGLEEGKLYSYIVQARNDNGEYSALSDRSAALDQKAVKTARKTKVTGFPTKKSVKARSDCKLKLKITAPDGRTAVLQEYVGKKWKNTDTKIKLPKGIGTETVTVTLPDSWWTKDKTSWRLTIPKSSGATKYTTGTFKLTTKRYYQNPKKYVQITNKISKHGHSYYTAPVLVNNASTKKDHIEAMIKTARKYLGDPYVVCQSRAPGKGVDCSGLVMQACYGAGVDLWPSNPYRHRSPAYEWESRNIAKHSNLRTVPYKDRKRGDLIFYANSNGVVIHVAIYLGNNKIIHSAPPGVRISGMGYAYGHVCKVKRIFN